MFLLLSALDVLGALSVLATPTMGCWVLGVGVCVCKRILSIPTNREFCMNVSLLSVGVSIVLDALNMSRYVLALNSFFIFIFIFALSTTIACEWTFTLCFFVHFK